jgi:hypothetical protein
MTHWKLGNRDEANKYYEFAVAALKTEPKGDPELLRFRTEAANLMGLALPKPDPKS